MLYLGVITSSLGGITSSCLMKLVAATSLVGVMLAGYSLSDLVQQPPHRRLKEMKSLMMGARAMSARQPSTRPITTDSVDGPDP